MEDITKHLRGKKNNAKRLVTNTIDNPSDRGFLIKVLDNAFADIVTGSVVLLSKKSEMGDILDKQSISSMSESLTDILDNFYQVENYLDFRKNLETNKIKAARQNSIESSMESFQSPGGSVDSLSGSGGNNLNGLGAVFQQYLPELTAKFDELAAALENFSLDGGGDELDIDLGGGGKPGSRRPPRMPGRIPKGAIPRSPFTLGGVARGGVAAAAAIGVGALGYLGYQAVTGGFSGGSATPGQTLGPGQYAPVGDLSKVTGDWKNDKEFISAVGGLASKYNVDANDLLGLMYNESAGTMSPTVRGKNGATGLFQFMPQYFNTDAISKMTRAQQVALADEKIFAASKMPRGANAGQIYAAVFLPSIARNQGWTGVLSRSGDKYYSSNPSLDAIPKDGVIDYNDLAKVISGHRTRMGLGPSPSLTNSMAGEPGVVNKQGMVGPLGALTNLGSNNYGQFRQYYNNGKGGNHPGIDIPMSPNTPVHAVKAGTVILAKSVGSYGNVVYIDHKDGIQTRYAHLLDGSMRVSSGQDVKAGDIIGGVGSTGRSTGNHLHFEVRLGQSSSTDNALTRSVNPVPYMEGTGAAPALNNASTNRPTPAIKTGGNQYQAAQNGLFAKNSGSSGGGQAQASHKAYNGQDYSKYFVAR